MFIIHKALFFGTFMDHSLINPNRIWHNNIQVCDNSFDSATPLGIDHNNAPVPFVTQGAAVFFETYMPSDEDLADCKLVVLTSDAD